MGEGGGTRLVFTALVALGEFEWLYSIENGAWGLFVTDLNFKRINMNPCVFEGCTTKN